MLTTSFPVNPTTPVSGSFILRLVENLPAFVHVTIITPCGVEPPETQSRPTDRFRLKCFRYAPWTWQCITHQPGGIPSALRENKIAWLLIPSLLLRMFVACLGVSRSVDVIHANWSVNGLVAGLAGLLTRTPVITTLRGSDVNRVTDSALFRWILWASLSLSTRTVAVSESLARTAASYFPKPSKRITFIPNGIDEALFSLPLPDHTQPTNILSVSNLVPNKDVATIIRAVALLPRRMRWTLTVLGDGPEAAKLKAQASTLGVARCIDFAGSVPPWDVPSFLERAHVFVVASHSEGRSNALLEALAAGRPVAATRIPGITEVIRDEETGLLFEVGAARALARQLARLGSDYNLRRKLGDRARQLLLEQRLLWSETGDRYAKLYREVGGQQKQSLCAD